MILNKEQILSLTLLALLAFTPILLGGILLVGFRRPASQAMPIVYASAVVIALFAWKISFTHVLASTIQGLVITFDLLFIIFGAILLLNTLKHSGGIKAILFARRNYAFGCYPDFLFAQNAIPGAQDGCQ